MLCSVIIQLRAYTGPSALPAFTPLAPLLADSSGTHQLSSPKPHSPSRVRDQMWKPWAGSSKGSSYPGILPPTELSMQDETHIFICQAFLESLLGEGNCIAKPVPKSQERTSTSSGNLKASSQFLILFYFPDSELIFFWLHRLSHETQFNPHMCHILWSALNI